VPSDGHLANRVAAAMAFADLVYERELPSLRVCAYAGCDKVVVDLSKNRSKQYCDDGCGHRAAVTAYRARKAAGKEPARSPTTAAVASVSASASG
jgi:predicted RNA-binding Zn ribbon-like protein